MSAKMVHIGFGNYLSGDRIVAITTPSAAPIKRDIQDARDEKRIIDLSNGHKTKSIIFTDCRYLVLAALEPNTINGRLETR